MSIIAALSTTNATSEAKTGAEIVAMSASAGAAAAGFSVVYRGVTTGSFSVILEGGYRMADGTIAWGEVATIDQGDVNNPVVLTIAGSYSYRMRHVSGVNVTAILA